VAEREYDVRVELLKQLLQKVHEDPFPSTTMLDQIEELLTPEEVPAYARILLAKIEDENFPSTSMIYRIAGLT
jgi:hypothetical protein